MGDCLVNNGDVEAGNLAVVVEEINPVWFEGGGAVLGVVGVDGEGEVVTGGDVVAGSDEVDGDLGCLVRGSIMEGDRSVGDEGAPAPVVDRVEVGDELDLVVAGFNPEVDGRDTGDLHIAGEVIAFVDDSEATIDTRNPAKDIEGGVGFEEGADDRDAGASTGEDAGVDGVFIPVVLGGGVEGAAVAVPRALAEVECFGLNERAGPLAESAFGVIIFDGHGDGVFGHDAGIDAFEPVVEPVVGVVPDFVIEAEETSAFGGEVDTHIEV